MKVFRPWCSTVAQTAGHPPTWGPSRLIGVGLVLCTLTGCEAEVGGPPGAGAPGSDGGSVGGALSADGGSLSSGSGGASAGGGLTGSGGGTPQTPSGIEFAGDPEFFRVIRLTHAQWEHAVRDILELPELPGQASGFLPDPPEGKFKTNERALYMTDGLRLDLQRAAEEVAAGVTETGGLPASLGASPAEVIGKLGHRAFRRELSGEELARYQGLWEQGASFYQTGDGFRDGARIFLEALLQSPHFLYRIQLSEDGQRLDGNELATKLSFSLLDTTPSDELLERAEAGDLDTDEGLLEVAEEMLDSALTAEVMEHFHEELFGLDRYHSILKDTDAFPEYDESLNQILYEADLMFFSHIFSEEKSVRSILTSRTAFASDALAPFYGISSPGPELTEVELDETRPGYLTRLGFLAYNGNLSEPDPIHRGVDINNKLLCANISPPPGEIPALPPIMPGQTNRERVTAHTGEGFCAGCHVGFINPPGFALEGFDAMGQARTMDNGKTIDTTGTFPLLEGAPSFEGIGDLAELLAESPRLHACYASHVLEYVLSRDLAETDGALITDLGDKSLASDLPIKSLLLSVVTSPAFTHSPAGAP